MSLTALVQLAVAARQTSDLDLASRVSEINAKFQNSFDDGAGAGQANKIFSDHRSISSSSSETLDLAGTLLDAWGSAITFASVKALIIRAAAGNTNNVVVGANGSAEFASFFGDVSDTIVIPPGGIFCITNPGAAGFAVTASSADILKVANSGSGSAVEYDVVIIGD